MSGTHRSMSSDPDSYASSFRDQLDCGAAPRDDQPGQIEDADLVGKADVKGLPNGRMAPEGSQALDLVSGGESVPAVENPSRLALYQPVVDAVVIGKDHHGVRLSNHVGGDRHPSHFPIQGVCLYVSCRRRSPERQARRVGGPPAWQAIPWRRKEGLSYMPGPRARP